MAAMCVPVTLATLGMERAAQVRRNCVSILCDGTISECEHA